MEKFILYDQLSKGDSCVLYKARAKNTVNFLAVKCADKLKKGEIANMVRLTHKIEHDNIVKFYEWYETSCHLWLMFELCTGGTLELVIQQDHNLPEDSIKEFGIDITKALYHLHSLDIIYSDLQPSKILVSGAGHLKLADFGLSRIENEDLDAVMASLFNPADEMEAKQFEEVALSFPDTPENLKNSGNPKYMAPEVINGGRHSVASDLWSLGCLLYEMFSGFPPFLAENFALLRDRILNMEPSTPKSPHGPPSQDFLDLIQGLLKKRPQMRLKWKELLAHPFWRGALVGHLGSTTSFCHQGTSPRDSQETLKQNIRQSITNFKVFKEFEEKNGEDDGDSDDTLADDGEVEHSTFGESSLRLKEGNDDDICMEGLGTNGTMFEQKGHSETQNSDDFRSDASERTCISSEFNEAFGLVFHPSDFLLAPVANLRKGSPKVSCLKFDSKALPIIPVDVQKLDENGIEDHLRILAGMLPPIQKTTPPAQKLVQLLNYIGSISHKNPDVCNRLISMKVINNLAKQSKDSSQIEMKLKLCQLVSVIVTCANKLDPDVDLSEALSNLVGAAREHSTNQKLKTTYLATIGQMLTLITKQEKEMEQVGSTWLVPATVYSLVGKCLAEGVIVVLPQLRDLFSKSRNHAVMAEMEDVVSNLYAARIIANVAACKSNHVQRFLSIDICNNLWSLYLLGTTESIKVAAINALSRLSRYSPTLALNLFEMHGLSQYLQAMSTTGNIHKLQQPGVTLLVLILSSDARPVRWLQDKEPLSFLMRLLESSSSVVRAKAYLGILEIITASNDQLLFVCQSKLLMTIEKDLKRTSSDGGSKVSEYIQECLKVVTGRLVGVLPRVFDEVLSSFEIVQGRKHLTSAHQKQLRFSLSLLQIVQHFINSSTFRPKIISKSFLRSLSKLYEFLVLVQSSAFQLHVVLGPQNYEEFVHTTFGCSEFIVLHCDVIGDHVDVIINNILSHLSSLVTCSSGDLKLMSLRFFCEACVMLLSDDKRLTKPQMKCLERLLDAFMVSLEQILIESDRSSHFHALRLLREVLERRPHFNRNLEQTNLAASLFQVVYSHHNDLTCNAVEQVVGVLRCFISCKDTDLRHLFQMGFTQFLMFIFLDSNLFRSSSPRQDGGGDCEGDVSSPPDESLDQLLSGVLALFHSLMRRVSDVIRGALEAKKAGHKVSSDAAEAKDLLILNKDFVAFMTPLSQLLPHKDEEISEESLKCLGLLIQFYGGENPDSLSVENQLCYNTYLKRVEKDVKKQKIMLRLIKRLITTREENTSKMLLTNTQLFATVRNVAELDRSEGVSSIAREILEVLSNSH